MQHGVGGLQVAEPATASGSTSPPRDDAFVVNLGEMLQAMTGNYFVATTHRVIADRGPLLVGLLPRPRSAHPPRPAAARPPSSPPPSPPARATPRAGFMAKRDELVAGGGGIASTAADVYGQQLWNYYLPQLPRQRPGATTAT